MRTKALFFTLAIVGCNVGTFGYAEVDPEELALQDAGAAAPTSTYPIRKPGPAKDAGQHPVTKPDASDLPPELEGGPGPGCVSKCDPTTCQQDDGCGSPCPAGPACCTPSCTGKVCGAGDGCGGTCATDCCTPNCTGKACGTDGCGGSCGPCGSLGCATSTGTCCTTGPACNGACCAAGQKCTGLVCCTPSCSGKSCGSDGCGGSCGACGAGSVCNGTSCVCQPNCTGKTCGSDGCGGSCGSCSAPLYECISNRCSQTKCWNFGFGPCTKDAECCTDACCPAGTFKGKCQCASQ